MNKFTRRMFGKHLLAATALPLIKLPSVNPQAANPEQTVVIPGTIAGYDLTAEDKQLAAKFLSTHEKNMSTLREKDLPNSLPPSFNFASPRPNNEPSSR